MTATAVNSKVMIADSVTCARNFLKLGIGAIAYHRRLFGESEFSGSIKVNTGREDDDRCTPCLKDDNAIVQMLSAVFAALQRQYLRQVNFVIYDAATFEPLESYPFYFTYGGDDDVNVTLDIDGTTRPGANAQIKGFLDDLLTFLTSLPPMPVQEVGWTLQLGYYEGRTPADYHPVGFGPAPGDVVDWSALQSGVVTRMVGAFKTPHHMVSMGSRPMITAAISDGRGFSLKRALTALGHIKPQGGEKPLALGFAAEQQRDGMSPPQRPTVPHLRAATPAVAHKAPSPLQSEPLVASLAAQPLPTAQSHVSLDASAGLPPGSAAAGDVKRRLALLAAGVFYLWCKVNKPSGRFQARDITKCPVLVGHVGASVTSGSGGGSFSTGNHRNRPTEELSVVVPCRDVTAALTREKLTIPGQGSGWYLIDPSARAMETAAKFCRDPLLGRVVNKAAHDELLDRIAQDLASRRAANPSQQAFARAGDAEAKTATHSMTQLSYGGGGFSQLRFGVDPFVSGSQRASPLERHHAPPPQPTAAAAVAAPRRRGSAAPKRPRSIFDVASIAAPPQPRAE